MTTITAANADAQIIAAEERADAAYAAAERANGNDDTLNFDYEQACLNARIVRHLAAQAR